MTHSDMSLEEVRARINELDQRIVKLIAERQRCVVAAGALKADEQAVRAPDRVEQVIAKVRALAESEGASPEVVERSYRAMIAAFIDLELDQHRAGVSNRGPSQDVTERENGGGAMHTFNIEGAGITSITDFYAEINRVFMKGVDWQLGENLDALNDMLYGGYGAAANSDEITVVWKDHAVAQRALGTDATKAWLEAKLRAPETFNISFITEQLAALLAGRGQTYFELLVEVFEQHPRVTFRLE